MRRSGVISSDGADRSAGGAPPGRRRAAGAVLFALSLLVTLGALEVLLRWFPAPGQTAIGWATLAGRGRRNGLGFRDFEYPGEKPRNRFRILVAGDSFTSSESVALGDSYVKRLEWILNLCMPASRVYEVLNLGRARRSTPEEVALLAGMIERLDADLVVVGYCLNDAEDWKDPAGVFALRKKLFVREYERPAGLLARSALWRWVSYRWFTRVTYSGQQRYYQALYEPGYSGWRRTREAFRELGELSRRTGVPARVMIFPLLSFGLGPDYPFFGVHEKLHRELEDAEVRYLDLLPAYRGEDPARLQAIPFRDPHPSEIGHRIAAEALWRHLVDANLLPDHPGAAVCTGPAPYRPRGRPPRATKPAPGTDRGQDLVPAPAAQPSPPA